MDLFDSKTGHSWRPLALSLHDGVLQQTIKANNGKLLMGERNRSNLVEEIVLKVLPTLDTHWLFLLISVV